MQCAGGCNFGAMLLSFRSPCRGVGAVVTWLCMLLSFCTVVCVLNANNVAVACMLATSLFCSYGLVCLFVSSSSCFVLQRILHRICSSGINNLFSSITKLSLKKETWERSRACPLCVCGGGGGGGRP